MIATPVRSNKVGVAPGTATIVTPHSDKEIKTFLTSPAGLAAVLKDRQNKIKNEKNQGLGIVLPYPRSPYPYEIATTSTVTGLYKGSYDKQFHTKGEPGLYYDTPLGGIPTPLQLARTLNYVPTTAPVTPFPQADGRTLYWTGPWTPPNGYVTTPNAVAPAMLGEVAVDPIDPVQLINKTLADHQRKQFLVSVVVGAASVIAAIVTIVKNVKELREGQPKYQAKTMDMERI